MAFGGLGALLGLWLALASVALGLVDRWGNPFADVYADHRFDLVRWEVENGAALVASRLADAIPGRQPDCQSAEASRTPRCIERAVATVLAEEGLTAELPAIGRTDFVFPPVAFVLSPPPSALIVSPRDRIAIAHRALLEPGLPAAARDAIEVQLEARGYAALVEPIGGFATYPSLVQHDAGLPFVVATVAHEWLHHYLFFQPLGRAYFASDEMTTINETIADLAGGEIGRRALEKLTVAPSPEAASPPPPPPQSGGFDFAAEMRHTRQTVEAMLEEGQIDAAEAFMRERRDYLESQGYGLRRLNQAYFAFYGTYADSPASVSPIGEQLRRLRQQSASVGDFVRRASAIGGAADLETAVGR